MRNLYGVISCCVLLSLAVVLDNAHAKNPQRSAEVSAISLDVLRVKACAVGQGCSTVGGPKQWNLFDLAEGKTDFANQVLMPAKTHELRLMLGSKSTITVDGQTYSLTVPSGQVSGLKLKGNKVFASASGFLKSIMLNFDLAKGLVVQAKKVKGKDKKGGEAVDYSYSLKPVIQVSAAEITPMPENMAGVFVMPDESSKLKLGKDFLLSIPVGAVSVPILITAEETKYLVEVKDEATGEIVKKSGMASTYELGPEGTQFTKPLKLAIRYHTDTLPSRISENDLSVFHDGDNIPTKIDASSQTASGSIFHFSTVTVSVKTLYGDCEDGIIEDGIVHRDCGDKAGYPDMHVVLIDRNKLKDKYKLRILSDDAWDGTFTTQTVEQLAKANDAVVAINGMKFRGKNLDYSKPSSGAYPTYTLFMGGILREDYWNVGTIPEGSVRGNEILMAFGDNSESSYRIPIKLIDKEELIDTVDRNKVPPQKRWQDIPDSESETCNQYQGESKINCKWADSTLSLKDIGAMSNDPEDKLFRFSSPDILSWAAGSSDSILKIENNEYTCMHQNDLTSDCLKPGCLGSPELSIEDCLIPGCLNENVSAIGYTDKEIIFVVSDLSLSSIGDSKFATWYRLCETFRVHGDKIQAVNLDGGCSPQLVIKGDLKNGYCSVDRNPDDRWWQPFFPDGPRHVINAIGLVPKGKEDPEPAAVIVDSVLPETAILGVSTTFTVTGQNLPVNMAFSLKGCEDTTSLPSISTSRQFRCIPSSLGQKSGVIESRSRNGIILEKFTVTVSENPVSLPVVYSVTPNEAVRDEPTIFTVNGQNLPSTLDFWFEGCEDIEPLSGSSTSMQFRCTPSSEGSKSGIVTTRPYGVTLKEFTVTVSEKPATLPVVSSVTPTEAVLDELTTFTVTGQNLPSTLEFLLEDCIGVKSLGGSSTAMRFSCTPRITTGQKIGRIEQIGGAVLKEFTVEVSN